MYDFQVAERIREMLEQGHPGMARHFYDGYVYEYGEDSPSCSIRKVLMRHEGILIHNDRVVDVWSTPAEAR